MNGTQQHSIHKLSQEINKEIGKTTYIEDGDCGGSFVSLPLSTWSHD